MTYSIAYIFLGLGFFQLVVAFVLYKKGCSIEEYSGVSHSISDTQLKYQLIAKLLGAESIVSLGAGAALYLYPHYYDYIVYGFIAFNMLITPIFFLGLVKISQKKSQ